jgi:hypothetical protein
MSGSATLAKLGGWSVVAGAIIGLMSGYLLLAAVGFDLAALASPATLLDGDSSTPGLLRWGALTDMFGYYLLFVPFFVAVGAMLRPRAAELADLFTLGGVMYSLIGASAAAVLAIAGSDLLQLHADSSGATREAAAVGFHLVSVAVYYGAWQTLELIPLGLWAGGTGLLFWRSHPRVGAVGVVVALVCWASSILSMAGATPRLGLALVPIEGTFFVLFWGYTLWIAWQLIRGDLLDAHPQTDPAK